MADLFKIADARGSLAAHAIFIHGLTGHAYDTWRRKEGAKLEDDASFWPRWLAEDCDGLAVWTVGYEAPASQWGGPTMYLTERAGNVLARLQAEDALREGDLYLIGHSFGGLIVKQMLRKAESDRHHSSDAASFLDRVRKVAFLATPHTGSALANLTDLLRLVIRPSQVTQSLELNDPHLVELSIWYRDFVQGQKMNHLVLRETKPAKRLATVVKTDSGDPGIAGAGPIGIDADHTDICKPSDRTKDNYVLVRDLIRRTDARPTSLPEEIVAELKRQGFIGKAAEAGVGERTILDLARRIKPAEQLDLA
jgi:pimeloyl-ACP methyl ester carboxylesterase